MIIGGKEVGIKKQPLVLLKQNVCDKSLDLEDMISRNKEFEDGLDYVLNMNVRNENNNTQYNANRSLFTQETVRATTAKVLSSIQEENRQKNNEEFER